MDWKRLKQKTDSEIIRKTSYSFLMNIILGISSGPRDEFRKRSEKYNLEFNLELKYRLGWEPNFVWILTGTLSRIGMSHIHSTFK